jgi:hypothetical protein
LEVGAALCRDLWRNRGINPLLQYATDASGLAAAASLRLRVVAPLAIAIVLLCGASGFVSAGELSATRIGSRIDVTVGGDFFTSYHVSTDEKYPFFFPVNGPSGASVTSTRNGKYPHHSSLFFGCDKVNGGNYWQDKLEAGQILSEGPVIVRGSGPEIVITDVCHWKRPGAEQPFRDVRRIVLSAPEPATRQIDVEILLEALIDVTIAKTNHSFFSVRMDPDLAPTMGGTMLNAEGKSGEKDTFGQPSAWMVCSGPRAAGQIEGLAVFQHPANRWAPSPWFTRDYGFMSPTPMFWPADGKVTQLARGEKVLLRYRVLVFAGQPERAELARKFAAYAAASKP